MSGGKGGQKKRGRPSGIGLTQTSKTVEKGTETIPPVSPGIRRGTRGAWEHPRKNYGRLTETFEEPRGGWRIAAVAATIKSKPPKL